ncbi:hypothetical protein [Planctobacterium marinum]|uniref:hypothetical protein n=1 Tax=Planctobacterium marinum TaxID=1631968 RepID=UPI001E44BC15|nr:hypothetical protein [Planctobacterium marinum]MCC2607743.1 hypothetical protein [Planctobacterium marinum]
MSLVTDFELKARRSAGLSVLNALRVTIETDDLANFSESKVQVLKDAFEFSKTTELNDKMVSYNFRSAPLSQNSSITISDALVSALRELSEHKPERFLAYFTAFQSIVDQFDTEEHQELTPEDRQNAIELIEKSMLILNSAKTKSNKSKLDKYLKSNTKQGFIHVAGAAV